MACQRPGALLQNICKAPLGLSKYLSSAMETLPAVPMTTPTTPGLTSPAPVVWMTASPPPA